MKFHRLHLRTAIALFLLTGMIAACAPSRPSGAPRPKKNKNHKKCNCPKWTTIPGTHQKTAHPYA